VDPDSAWPTTLASRKETRVKSIKSYSIRTAETSMIMPAHSSSGTQSDVGPGPERSLR